MLSHRQVRPTASRSRAPRAPAVAALLALLLPAGAPAQEQSGYDYPETATSPATVDSMLRLAGVTGADTVYDLGSGDGRIVIRAAERYGAAGVGIEIDADLVAEARRRARKAGVADRVRFIEGNFFEVDLRPATVVTTYLLPGTMRRLPSHLLRELRPRTRVVSHDFDMDAWPADSVIGWWDDDGGRTTLLRWVVPARVGGSWRLRLPEAAGGT
ncbi:MAG: cyclopropane-fatty-acyl-phospholipid synthase family protein, partial [Gemmatimonadota bacterium]